MVQQRTVTGPVAVSNPGTSVRQLALAYRDTHTLFPLRKPGKRGGLVWELPQRYVLHKLLSHPIYAGAYVHGRTRSYVDYAHGKLVKRTKRIAAADEWRVCLRDHHAAYISWERYQENRRTRPSSRPAPHVASPIWPQPTREGERHRPRIARRRPPANPRQ